MERTGNSDPRTERVDVAVVGGGLAGLAAGATATRAGASTVVLDAHAGGGRAAVRRVPLEGCDGEVLFNSGPRALYLAGAGRPVLDRLGVTTSGATAPTRGSAALVDGRLDLLPVGAGSLLRTGIVRSSSKPALVAVLAALLSGMVRAGRPDESAAAWIAERSRGRDDVATALAALFRLTTYTSDLDELAADAAVAQMRLALGPGVRYLDGGFQQIIDGLRSSGGADGLRSSGGADGLRSSGGLAGMAVRDHVAVRALEQRSDGDWTVTCADGSEVQAASVVVASGGPAVASSLLDLPGLAAAAGPPVTAACLELAVAGAVPTRFVLGIDELLYLSEHCPPADLAPEGVRVVHLARYGATDAAVDRSRLEDLARQAGIRDDDVVARRFLGRMVVQTAMPSVSGGGLPGRASVTVPERRGVFLAGDWVGPIGLLADASLASGESAGTLAAAHARRTGAVGAAGTTPTAGAVAT